MENRVIAVSMATSSNPLLLMGSVTPNGLHLIKVERIKSNLADIKSRLQEAVDTSQQHGASLFLEDTTGMLGSYGYDIKMDRKLPDGRPVLVVAIERYEALKKLNAITYPSEGGSTSFVIGSGIMETLVGDDGKTTYRIDWSQLNDESRVLLLLIYGGMCQHTYHQGYLDRVYKEVGKQNVVADKPSSFHALTTGYDNAVNKRHVEASENINLEGLL